jgi:alanyl-tRNA synthetase
MQQHTGQHLLSAVLFGTFEARTVSFHMGAEVSTIELAGTSLGAADLQRAEMLANEVIAENRPVTIAFEDASVAGNLRKATERTGTIRVVTIEQLDRSACGGTHVRSTGEIGCVLLRGTEKIRGNLRLEFVCGLRAVSRARRDFDCLSALARKLASPADEVPRVVALQMDRLADAEKTRKKLSAELAALRGRQAYTGCTPLPSGTRLRVQEIDALTDEVRLEAQAFVQSGPAVVIASAKPAGAVLVASSLPGVHAGNLLKPVLTATGGRGGGSAELAQGSVPDSEGVASVVDELIRIAVQH